MNALKTIAVNFGLRIQIHKERRRNKILKEKLSELESSYLRKTRLIKKLQESDIIGSKFYTRIKKENASLKQKIKELEHV
jgi:phage-related minor tail protein